MASKRGKRRKSCEGKVRHTSRGHAAIACKKIWKEKGARTRTYHCPFCKGWHIGHFGPIDDKLLNRKLIKIMTAKEEGRE